MPQQPDELRSIVSRMVDAGESEENIASVIKRYNEKGSTQPETPTSAPAWTKAIPGLAATGAGFIGKSPLVSTGMAAGAGALGEGVRGFLDFLYSPSAERGQALGNLPARMVGQGVKQGAAELTGRVIPAPMKAAARGLYRAAALPINKMGKYGDLIAEGLTNRVPVSQSGLKKAGELVATRKGAKTAALAAADERVTMLPGGVADDALDKARTYVSKQTRAGMANPDTIFDRIAQFRVSNPKGVTPTDLNDIKGTIDDSLGGAYKKLRMREPITPDEKYGLEMSQAQSRALEQAVPQFREMNKGVMNAEGLRQMVQRRVSPGSSGGNQGLENALTMLGGLQAIPARLAMLPPVLSRAGIGLNEAAKVAPFGTSAALRALLALMEPDRGDKQE